MILSVVADITYVTVGDVAASRVCLAWDSTRRNALISEYVAIVLGSIVSCLRRSRRLIVISRAWQRV